jgi:hypothetical protein
LTGPKQGLALISSSYVETNLIIKGDEKQQDRELSKALFVYIGLHPESFQLRACSVIDITCVLECIEWDWDEF